MSEERSLSLPSPNKMVPSSSGMSSIARTEHNDDGESVKNIISIWLGHAPVETIQTFNNQVDNCCGSVSTVINNLLQSKEHLSRRYKFAQTDELEEWTIDIPENAFEDDLTYSLQRLDAFVQSSRLDSRAAAIEELLNSPLPFMTDESTQTSQNVEDSTSTQIIEVLQTREDVRIEIQREYDEDDSDYSDFQNVENKEDGIETAAHDIQASSIYIPHVKKKKGQSAKRKSSAANEEDVKPTDLPKRGRPRKSNGVPICEICGKTFARASSLAQHTLLHTGQRPFVCHICGQTFRKNGALKDHLQTHKIGKDFECDVCGNQFTLAKGLQQHKRIHTDERPYQCNICSTSFRCAINLREHRTLHTGEMKYQCSHCDKKFRKWSSRYKHERIHTGLKPHACPECQKCFTQKYNMTTHRRKVHWKIGKKK